MKPTVLCGLAVLALSVWLLVETRAGEPMPYERIVKEMLGTLEHISEELSKITNQDTAEAATPKLKSAAEKLLQLRKQAAELKQPDKAEKDRLAREYAGKFELVVKELTKQESRVKGIPGGAEAVKELAILSEKKDAKDKKKSDK
jgi:hypothetical protein